jgi:hypothetical protein
MQEAAPTEVQSPRLEIVQMPRCFHSRFFLGPFFQVSPHFVRLFVLVCVGASSFFTSQIRADNLSQVRQEFLSPLPAARPAVYWCWLNGYVDDEALITELDELAAKGISGVYVFDIGARSWDKPLPAGPPFLSPQWMSSFSKVVRKAGKVGIEVGLITSSSWNAGGPWIPPELAAMGLYQSSVIWEGPGHRAAKIPLPPLPAAAPRDSQGRPLFYQDVALLALPEKQVRTTEHFIFQLRGTDVHIVDRVVLYQAGEASLPKGATPRPVKDFALWLSETSDEPEAFRLALRATLTPEPGPQEFRIPPTKARFAMLELLSGYNETLPGYDLAEFELYNREGQNVASALKPDGTRTGAALLWWGSQSALDGPGSASCIHDGITDTPRGIWRSAELPPLILEGPHEVLDLTSALAKDGTLTWDVPPGRWRIVRYGCGNTGQRLVLPSPESAGLVLDHLNPDATRFHFEYILSRLQEHLGDFRQTALRQLYVCSYEVRGATWTPRFLEEFARRRGYDMKAYLPALDGCIVGDWPQTRRFLHDFRKTLGELLTDSFYRHAAEICRENGLKLCAEAGGPGLPLHQVPVDALEAQGAIDIPRGEFWIQHDIWVVKETACAAHIYGKPVVDMEAFTSWRHWQDGPWQLKPIADRAFAEGANHFTFHTMAHRPFEVRLPGWVYHAGTHFSPHIAWWPLADAFLDYISRSSALLQHGQFVADVCYYYGDGGFRYVPPKHIDPRLGFGYDYDVCNAEVLLTRAEVQHGKPVFRSGGSTGYHLLVLPDSSEISPPVLERLARLVEVGLTLVGTPPRKSNSLFGFPHSDADVARLSQQLWGSDNPGPRGEHRFGKGRVIWGIPLREILLQSGIGPDFLIATFDPSHPAQGTALPEQPNSWPLDYLHRQSPEVDIYFVWNKTDRWQNHWVRLRSDGHNPETWDPVTGRMMPLLARRDDPRGISLYLQLPPYGTTFIVLDRRKADASQARGSSAFPGITEIEREGRKLLQGSEDPPAVLLEMLGPEDQPGLLFAQGGAYRIHLADGSVREISVASPKEHELPGPWTVRFSPGWGAPEEIIFPKLIPWNEHPDPGIRYYSGLAVYRIHFELPKLPSAHERIILTLGEVHFLGRVLVNGNPVSTVWTAPWEVDITEHLQAGTNTLEIQVANDWNNRLVGDALLPPEKRLTETNIPYSISWRRSWKDTPLQSAGLVGPVRLRKLTFVPVSQW